MPLPRLWFARRKEDIKQAPKHINSSHNLEYQWPRMSAIKNQASTIYAEGFNNAGQAICETKDYASKFG